MELALIIPVAAEGEQRLRWAEASFDSLRRTRIPDGSKLRILVVSKNWPNLGNLSSILKNLASIHFDCRIIGQPDDAKTIDACNVFGWKRAVEDWPDVTHLAMGTADWVYHPMWMEELKGLLARHPEAKSCWVYRSAFEQYHKTLKVDGDVMVRSINAGGCFPAEDFREWNPDYHEFRIGPPRVSAAQFDEKTGVLTYWAAGKRAVLNRLAAKEDALRPVNLGLTLDLYDPWLRQGERWVTKRSWILNIGIEGENQRVDAPEYAVDWVGL
jgi:hypothetical protein